MRLFNACDFTVMVGNNSMKKRCKRTTFFGKSSYALCSSYDPTCNKFETIVCWIYIMRTRFDMENNDTIWIFFFFFATLELMIQNVKPVFFSVEVYCCVRSFLADSFMYLIFHVKCIVQLSALCSTFYVLKLFIFVHLLPTLL